MVRVNVISFSYRKGIPIDVSGHGGGFVFDCRFIENPGLIDSLKGYTGKDEQIKDFFKNDPEMDLFLKQTLKIIVSAIEKYKQRKYSNLSVAYGCTGGRHRSVYATEWIAAQLAVSEDLHISIIHSELSL